MSNSLNVFFATSKLYLQHFTVAATSLLENNKDLDVRIFVIHEAMEESALEVPRNFFSDRYDVDITFINIGDLDFTRFRTNDYFGKYTYYRLFVADLIPADISTGLFLDVDLIVTGSLKALAEIDMTDKYVCAVSETSVADNVARLNELGVKIMGYFNAGVQLINLKAWRREALSEKFVRIADKYGKKLKWVDQDILNIYFADNWYPLDKTYNAIHLLEPLAATPLIVHYNTYSKPWHYVDTHPYNYLYQQYLQITPYKDIRGIGFSTKNFVMKNGRLFKRKLRKMGVIK
jgi:lipopolysaccharide biosynthesis glycosyltransferase